MDIADLSELIVLYRFPDSNRLHKTPRLHLKGLWLDQPAIQYINYPIEWSLKYVDFVDGCYDSGEDSQNMF